jgi:KipI family sensor histidine kinase inhibitor
MAAAAPDVPPARVVPFGDRAAVVGVDGYLSAHALAERLQGLPGVAEAVPGMRTVVVFTDNPVSEPFLESLGALVPRRGRATPEGREVLLPVAFDGADLDEVTGVTGLDPREVVSMVCSAPLTVAFLGFAPGFPYLVGLPDPISRVPRRASPRRAVPAGSVAVGGGFAGIYPSTSPGGWQLIGRTEVVLFDPMEPPYAALRPGDRVRFTRVPSPGGARPTSAAAQRDRLVSQSTRSVEVILPGSLSMVQGAPRRGLAGLGVPSGGPADRTTMALANRLVGNPDQAGAIELAGTGPTLRNRSPGHFAVVGAESGAVSWKVDGRPMPADTVVEVGYGQVIGVSAPIRGVRAYLAVSGGFEPPEVLGSVSSDLLSGLPLGPLRTGDVLAVGTPGRPRGRVCHRSGQRGGAELRVTAGPHRLGRGVLEALCERSWVVTRDSSRVGLRLDSAGLPLPGGEVASMGMVAGAVQLPPAGSPVVLGVDHGSMGGYPVAACVIDADLDRLGQLAAGDSATLNLVDLGEARRATEARRRWIEESVSGWFPSVTA